MILGANNKITTYRLVTASNKDTYDSSATLTDVAVYIEQVDPNIAVILDDQHAFETYKAYIDGDQDIIISDKVVDQDSVEYIVSGVQRFVDNSDVDNHIEVTMYKLYTV